MQVEGWGGVTIKHWNPHMLTGIGDQVSRCGTAEDLVKALILGQCSLTMPFRLGCEGKDRRKG